MRPDDIRHLRETLLGLSQQRFADTLRGIDPLLKADRNIVSRWERGVNRPSAHAVAAMQELAAQVDRYGSGSE